MKVWLQSSSLHKKTLAEDTNPWLGLEPSQEIGRLPKLFNTISTHILVCAFGGIHQLVTCDNLRTNLSFFFGQAPVWKCSIHGKTLGGNYLDAHHHHFDFQTEHDSDHWHAGRAFDLVHSQWLHLWWLINIGTVPLFHVDKNVCEAN